MFSVSFRSHLRVKDDLEWKMLWSRFTRIGPVDCSVQLSTGAKPIWKGTVRSMVEKYSTNLKLRSKLRKSHLIPWIFKKAGVEQKDEPLESRLISASEKSFRRKIDQLLCGQIWWETFYHMVGIYWNSHSANSLELTWLMVKDCPRQGRRQVFTQSDENNETMTHVNLNIGSVRHCVPNDSV